jgi:hypothetical protein
MAKNIEVTLTLDSAGYNKKLKQAKQNTRGFGGQANVTKGSVIGLAARFAPLAAGVIAVGAAFRGVSNSLTTAKGFQDVQITLSNLVGSAEGGAAALDMIKTAAQKLPFEFETLAQAAPALTTVSGTIGELEENMLLAADIAANFGIPFDVAAGQLQRSFTAGAGAADVFREKGITSAAGFQAGVTYSIDETQKKLKEFGETIEGSAERLNQSLSGALSQTEDRFTTFSASVGNAMSPTFEAFLTEMVRLFDENKEAVTAFGDRLGTAVVGAFRRLLTAGAVVVDFFIMLFKTIKRVTAFIQDEFGEVIATVMNVAVRAVAGVVEAVGFLGKSIGRLIEIATGDTTVKDFFQQIQDAANKTRTGGVENLRQSLSEIGDAYPKETGTQDFIAGILVNLDAGVEAIKERNKKIAENLKNTGKDTVIDIAQSLGQTIEEFSAQFGVLADGVLQTISTFESATTKLSDDLATALLEGQGAGEAFKNYFKTLVKDIVAQALRLAIIQPLLSSIFGVQFGAGGKVSGFGDGGLFNLSPKSNEGGGFTGTGARVGGVDGRGGFLSILHPNETVLDHAKGQGMGGGTTNVTYNISAVDAPSFQALVARDPEFIYSVTQAGRRRIPGGRL